MKREVFRPLLDAIDDYLLHDPDDDEDTPEDIARANAAVCSYFGRRPLSRQERYDHELDLQRLNYERQ